MYLENCISNLYKRLPIWELFSFVLFASGVTNRQMSGVHSRK